MGERRAEKRRLDDRTALKLGAAQIESRQVDAFEIAVGEMKRRLIAGEAGRDESLHFRARERGVRHDVSLRARSRRR